MDLSDSLVEGIVLLLLTAALTGLGVPMVLRTVDERRQRGQLAFQAALSRKEKVIAAQEHLLEELARLLWKLQKLAIEVSVARLDPNGAEAYAAAVARYSAEASGLLGGVRTEISKSLRLGPRAAYEGLRRFYFAELVTLDQRLRELVTREAQGQGEEWAWLAFNDDAVHRLGDRIDAEVDRVAAEFGLKQGDAP